jgi:hypothetical protein
MKYAFLLLFSLFGVFKGVAQPTIEWQRSYGGTQYEEAKSIQQTNDGGYIVAGYSRSIDLDITDNHGAYDFWVLKLSSLGEPEWKKSYGGTNNEWANAVKQTTDGGYIMAGFSQSNNGDVSGNHGDSDFWVVKLNQTCTIQWQKSLGGSEGDEARDIQQTRDGGYIVVGLAYSSDGDLTSNQGATDFWVVKLDSLGDITWQKSLGGSFIDDANAVKQTPDGGYIIVGQSGSNDGDVSGLNGGTDVWVVKLNHEGTLEWQRMLGGTGLDRAHDVGLTDDGGFILTGNAGWGDGDISHHNGGSDLWMVKLDFLGKIIWEKSLGGSSEDFATSIQQTSDGGFIAAGSTESTDGDVSNNDGGVDMWVVKLDKVGDLQWEKAIGGTMADRARCIQQTADGSFIIAGRSTSSNGDATYNRGLPDYWVVKLSPETTSSTLSPFAHNPLELYPNPASQSITVQIPGDLDETRLSVRITDLLGREIVQRACNNGESLDLAQLPNGMFLLSATSASGKVFFGKFRKQE